MNLRIFNAITGRLSLRPPQRESLQRLAQALDAAPAMLEHGPDMEAVLAALKAKFPTLAAFEREFPSLCFALATGVGKTRLMGAFIGYLHLAHGFKHFFVLAPNLTIYNKLSDDFMLKEGWDVTNLYTIVPLRAANARTLIEQSIGRGLRLPFGRRTGVPAVDRLNIVAHDRFQEIIDEANRGDSPIRLKQVVLDAPSETEPTISVQVGTSAEAALGLTEAKVTGGDGQQYSMETESLKTPAFSTEHERQAARAVMDVIGELERRSDAVPNSGALTKPDVQRTIAEQVRARLTPQQGELLPDEGLDLDAVVAKTTETVARGMIDIPRIAVVPTGEVTVGFHPFTLDLSGLKLQPADRELVIQHLQSNERHTLASEAGITEQRLEDYVVFGLLDYDDIDYEAHAELLYDLAGQMVRHLLEYLSEDEARAVLDRDRRLIAEAIHVRIPPSSPASPATGTARTRLPSTNPVRHSVPGPGQCDTRERMPECAAILPSQRLRSRQGPSYTVDDRSR